MFSTPSKKIFIVRHGQTEANVKKVFQDDTDQLTDLGREQAEHFAHHAVELAPEVIITSTMDRALETASIVQKETQVPLEKCDALREYMLPTSLVNKPYNSKESLDFHDELYKNIDNPDWRYTDEDNYKDLHVRSQEIMDMLTQRTEKRIMLVSHGAFISILLNTMMYEGELAPTSATRLFRFLRSENTGVSIIDHHENATIANKWRLKVWNDYSHLPRELRTLQ